tara:strand:- start:178 stop:387 length:210 start_codon:yes stop_codon:yes gene_type:complete
MKQGDLVRFKKPGLEFTSTNRAKRLHNTWRIGLLIEYNTWEKIARILYHGKIISVAARGVEKAGKKDEV